MDPDRLRPEVITPVRRGRPYVLACAAIMLLAAAAGNFAWTTRVWCTHCRAPGSPYWQRNYAPRVLVMPTPPPAPVPAEARQIHIQTGRHVWVVDTRDDALPR
jgi:hypothetical protein